MGRPRKNKVEEAANLANELIAAQAALKTGNDELAPEDETPVDELDIPDDSDSTDQGDFDLSALDEEEPAPIVQDDKKLAHQLSVLQGKYNAETERLSNLLSSTMTEVQNLKTQLVKKVPDASGLADLSDDDASIETLKEQFPALYKSFMALARVEARREVSNATRGTSEKVDAIVQKGEVDSKNVYYSELTKALPLWEKINNHPSFGKWLNEPDEFSGTSRKNLLGAAYNRNDHVTTLKFFNAFMKEKGIRVKGRPDDSEDIAPDTSGGGRSNRSAPGEITRAGIEKLYQDKARGKLSMTDAEFAKIEARYFQAVREGKVR